MCKLLITVPGALLSLQGMLPVVTVVICRYWGRRARNQAGCRKRRVRMSWKRPGRGGAQEE